MYSDGEPLCFSSINNFDLGAVLFLEQAKSFSEHVPNSWQKPACRLIKRPLELAQHIGIADKSKPIPILTGAIYSGLKPRGLLKGLMRLFRTQFWAMVNMLVFRSCLFVFTSPWPSFWEVKQRLRTVYWLNLGYSLLTRIAKYNIGYLRCNLFLNNIE